MRKIPTLFQRDFANNPRYVTSAVTGGCEWVLRGEGVATRKYDGTCVKLDEAGAWWARREVKPGKTPPPEFVVEEHDDVTGKTVGWEPARRSGFYKSLCEATFEAEEANDGGLWPVDTYELIGPRVNGNPEGRERHELIAHHSAEHLVVPLAYTDLAVWLSRCSYEGIVWHHDDGRMAKLKRRDFDVS